MAIPRALAVAAVFIDQFILRSICSLSTNVNTFGDMDIRYPMGLTG
jgi:hypothetical protein